MKNKWHSHYTSRSKAVWIKQSKKRLTNVESKYGGIMANRNKLLTIAVYKPTQQGHEAANVVLREFKR